MCGREPRPLSRPSHEGRGRAKERGALEAGVSPSSLAQHRSHCDRPPERTDTTEVKDNGEGGLERAELCRLESP